ncbi:MAG: hypothetical protein O7H41_09305 [Planctomycetota bacterium]|nr:hypothetical protein [Planctomycetota bacterium]
MLRFSTEPDLAFAEFLATSLEYEIDQLRDPDDSDEGVLANYSSRTRAIFNRQELQAQLEKLLEAHRSPAIYKLTDYHFLILHDVLQTHTEVHNDSLELSGEVRRYGDVVLGKIDVDAVLDVYFFDTDFLIDPEDLDALGGERKEMMGFAEDTWGVVNELKPHPEELSLRDASPDCFADDQDNERLYEPGEDYPVEPSEE